MAKLQRITATRIKDRKDFNSELNLTPLIDVMSVLIPFLLLTTVFVKLAVINVALPGLSDDKSNAPKSNKPNINIALGISEQKVIITLSDAVNTEKSFDIKDNQKIHEFLYSVKARFPHKTDILVIPDHEVQYETIVLLLDQARDFDPKDPPLACEDENNKPVKCSTMFPDVVIGSV